MENIGSETDKKEKFLAGMILNLDYKQKLYFQANDSLNNTIKFITGFYGAFLTIILALLNFSKIWTMEFSIMIYYCSIIIVFTLFVNSIGKSLILEAIDQYLIKEILFKEMDNIKHVIDEEYGVNPDENNVYAQKNFRVVQELYLTFLWFNAWVCWVSIVSAISFILVLIYEILSKDTVAMYYLSSLLFVAISGLGSYHISKNIKRDGDKYFEIEKRIWNNQITPQEKVSLKKDHKTAKKVIIGFIALILLGIYLKLKF